MVVVVVVRVVRGGGEGGCKGDGKGGEGGCKGDGKGDGEGGKGDGKGGEGDGKGGEGGEGYNMYLMV